MPPDLPAWFAVAGAVLAAGTAPWWPAAWRRWRRERIARRPFPATWRKLLRKHLPVWNRLPPDVQQRLKRHILVFVAEKPFIGCGGLTVSTSMRVLVAAQAGLLALNRPPGAFTNLREVLLYPGAFVVQRPVPDPSGLLRDERRVLAGESWQRGQVVLSWDDVMAGARDPADGRNVVIHEFAHQLDQESGAANGAPFLGRADRYPQWAAVWNAAWAEHRRRLSFAEPTVLDPYGAGEPAEFFAVACEAFFERPQALADDQPALYEQLGAYFGVDPRHWQ